MSVAELDLARLVRAPEGLYFERKSLFEGLEGRKGPRDRREVRDDVATVVAAFANADGGVLVLGVEDDGTPTGHRHPAKTVEDILAVPSARLTPPQPAGVRATLDGIEVFVFEVESATAPVMVQGDGYPCRVGDSVVRMEAHRIAAWKERGLIESWETRRSERTLADLDARLLESARSSAALKDASVESYLLHRRLADRKGAGLVLRHAAELLFGADSHVIDHPNAGVRLFRVIGAERKSGAQHNVEELPRFEGNVPTVVEAVLKTVQGLLRRPKRLRGLRFEELPEYPTFAWQEAIVNAVAHRDYALAGRGIEVWLYDDRMEVTSPGGLVADVPLEALYRLERVHMSRNPRLVRGLVDLGIMREQGEGIPRMFAEMEVQFLAPPELRATASEFSVTLRNAPVLTAQDAEWLGALQGEGISEVQLRALALARTRGQVTNAALRDASGLDTLAASMELRALRDAGLLALHGAGPASHYTLGPRATSLADERLQATDRGELGPDRGELGPDRGEFGPDRGELGPDRGEFGTRNTDLHQAREALVASLPADLQAALDAVGARPRKAKVRQVILDLCAQRPWRPAELVLLLGLTDSAKFVERHLSPMTADGLLVRTHPETPNHPDQAYRAARLPLKSDRA